MKEFRIGLLGAGWISQTYVAALQQIPEGRPVAVWSRTKEHAERFAERHGLDCASDRIDAIFAEVDVVCVNSPNACHAEHAIAAAEAGRHVIVEKPLAASVSDARAIVEACDRAGVGLAYAEELPFVPKFVRAKEILDSGVLGAARYVVQREAHAGPYSPWFFTRDEAGGGVLMDMACHSIECVRWLLGKPDVSRVDADLCTFDPTRTDLEDHALVRLEFETGTRALCEASWVLQGGMQSRLEIWGATGTLEVDLLGASGLRLYTPAGAPALDAPTGWSVAQTNWLSEAGYPQELSHFLRCFAEGSEPRESGADGIEVLEILHAAYASASQQRALDYPCSLPTVERAVDLWRPPSG